MENNTNTEVIYGQDVQAGQQVKYYENKKCKCKSLSGWVLGLVIANIVLTVILLITIPLMILLVSFFGRHGFYYEDDYGKTIIVPNGYYVTEDGMVVPVDPNSSTSSGTIYYYEDGLPEPAPLSDGAEPAQEPAQSDENAPSEGQIEAQ